MAFTKNLPETRLGDRNSGQTTAKTLLVLDNVTICTKFEKNAFIRSKHMAFTNNLPETRPGNRNFGRTTTKT